MKATHLRTLMQDQVHLVVNRKDRKTGESILNSTMGHMVYVNLIYLVFSLVYKLICISYHIGEGGGGVPVHRKATSCGPSNYSTFRVSRLANKIHFTLEGFDGSET